MTYAGEQDLKCFREYSFAVSFMHLKLRSGPRLHEGERNYKIVNIMCFLEGGYASEGSEKEAFQRRVNLDAQKQFLLASGKNKPFTT